MTWRFTTASNRCCGGSLHFQSNPLRLDPKSPAFFASPRGGVGPSQLHKRCPSIIFAGQLAGVRGMGWAGRRLCRPPAGCVWGRAPVGALGEGRWGAFFESAGVRCGRLGDPALPGGRRGWEWPARRSGPYRGWQRPGWAAGLQGGRSGCGGVQRAAWNSSRLGVRIARRWRSLRFRSLPMVLTRSRTESGT